MPLLRKNEGALNSDRLFRPAEQVPRTGIYELLHESGNAGMVVLVRDQQFPVCQDCGSSVRFRLLKAAPHISEDPDFQ